MSSKSERRDEAKKDEAAKRALEAVVAMNAHDEICAGDGYRMPKEKATLTCNRCGEVVYDGPYFEAEA